MQGVGGGCYALDDVRLRVVDSDGYTGFGDKLCKAAGVVRVSVGNDDTADPVEREAAFRKTAGYRFVASGEAGVDEDVVTGLGQDGDSGPDGANLKNAVGNCYRFVEHVWRVGMKLIVDCFIGMRRNAGPEVIASIG